jgi:hypothetical protein
MYDCRNILTINRISDGKTYHDVPEPDWTNLTEEFQAFDQEEYDRMENFESLKGMSDVEGFRRRYATKTVHRIKPEIIQWLNDNVKDRADKDQPQGWCIGSESYLAKDSTLHVNLFFHRQKDAVAFAKRWSSHKNLTNYFNYFNNTRKKLNPNTRRLETENDLDNE